MNLPEYPSLQGQLTLPRHTATDYTTDTVNEGATNHRTAGKYQRIDTAGHHRMSRLHFARLFIYHIQYGNVRFEKGKTSAIVQHYELIPAKRLQFDLLHEQRFFFSPLFPDKL
jgi:hypothetical protein